MSKLQYSFTAVTETIYLALGHYGISLKALIYSQQSHFYFFD